MRSPEKYVLKLLLSIFLMLSGEALNAQDIGIAKLNAGKASLNAGIAKPDSSYARAVINTLASPAYKGRGYYGDGAKKASAFIAGEFKKAGIIPLNKGSYFQEFNLPVNTFPGRVELSLNGQQLTTAKDYLIDAGSPALEGAFKVYPLNRADLNNPNKVLNLLDLAAGNFILLDNRPQANESAADKAIANKHLSALRADPDLKIKGLIIYSTEKLTWMSSTEQGPRLIVNLNKPDLDLVNIKDIKLAVDAKFIPMYPTRNVVGMIRGSSKTDSTIVITAHFDHLGMLGNQVYFPGANDNASGVAMMLSFVKYYQQYPPKYNTVFLAFSGEEIGILGSKAFIESPLIDLNRIRFLVNFDLAGTGAEGIKVVNGSIHKDKFHRLVQLNESYKLLQKVEPRGAACNSDHCWFQEKGIPSFFIYTQGGIAAYHDIYDRPETLPLTAFVPFFQLMAKFLGEL